MRGFGLRGLMPGSREARSCPPHKVNGSCTKSIDMECIVVYKGSKRALRLCLPSPDSRRLAQGGSGGGKDLQWK